MTNYVAAECKAGTVYFEVAELTVGPERVDTAGEHMVAAIDGSLDNALARVRPAAETVLDTFAGLGVESVEVQFGLDIDAQVGAVFTKAGVKGHFNIRAVWSRPEDRR
jgi:hypothetical protein